MSYMNPTQLPEAMKVPGVMTPGTKPTGNTYTYPVGRISFVRESKVTAEQPVITGPTELQGMLYQLLKDRDREVFVVFALDRKCKLIAAELCSIGDQGSCIVNPREVFKLAILLGAESIVVGHNHPSGNVTPSSEDCAVTTRLREAGDILGIEVLDHLIVGIEPGSYTSFKDRGLI